MDYDLTADLICDRHTLISDLKSITACWLRLHIKWTSNHYSNQIVIDYMITQMGRWVIGVRCYMDGVVERGEEDKGAGSLSSMNPPSLGALPLWHHCHYLYGPSITSSLGSMTPLSIGTSCLWHCCPLALWTLYGLMSCIYGRAEKKSNPQMSE